MKANMCLSMCFSNFVVVVDVENNNYCYLSKQKYDSATVEPILTD